MSRPALAQRPAYGPSLRKLLDPSPLTPARGSARADKAKRIVVSLDPKLFDRIAMLAAVSRVTMAEAVRQLIERGFEE